MKGPPLQFNPLRRGAANIPHQFAASTAAVAASALTTDASRTGFAAAVIQVRRPSPYMTSQYRRTAAFDRR